MGMDALLGVRNCSNKYKFSQVKLSEARGKAKERESCVEKCYVLSCHLMKPSPRLVGPNTDGAAFCCFINPK